MAMMLRTQCGLSCLLIALLLLPACSDNTTGPMADTAVDTAQMLDTSSPEGDADTVATGPCADLDEGAPCDDEDPCTLDDSCQAGLCLGASNEPCASENPCEPGVCVAGEGCQYEPVADGTSCTVNCFSAATCVAGKCQVDAETAVNCPDPGDEKPCVADLQCDQTTGACTVEILAPADTACDTDSNLCSEETCTDAGACESTGEVNSCTTEKADDPCHLWTCSKKTGACQANGFAGEVSCDDGNACSKNDTCYKDEFNFIGCLGAPVPVDDKNPCTDDACVSGTVEHTPIDGQPCDTGDVCTPTGLCSAGTCAYEGCECDIDADCDQPTDLCLGVAYCELGGKEPECKIKQGTPVVCPDTGDACTVSICQPDTGACLEEPAANETDCDDDNACTAGDVCTDGTCSPGTDVICDNGLYCDGAETCDTTLGCQAGLPPSLSDGLDCTDDSCEETSDTIVHLPSDKACDDALFCTGTETCNAATGCVAGIPVPIDDGIPCTEDSCTEGAGVAHTPSDALCDDGVFCNGVEGCDAKSGCEPGTAPVVNDGVDCTLDSCSEEDGEVQHLPFDASCNKGKACTAGVCDAKTGCSVKDLPDGTACPGGAGFKCSGGECVCTPTCDGKTCGDDGCEGTCACSEGLACADGICVGASGPWDGVWNVTANPNTQSLGGLGTASFVPFDLMVTVVNGVASGTADAGNQVLKYTGTATATTLLLTTNFVDAAGISHQEDWDVTQIDVTTFKGTMDETLSVLGFPFNLKWNVTGKKQ